MAIIYKNAEANEELKYNLMGMNQVAEVVHANAKSKGFYDNVGMHFLSHQLLEIMKEVGEASEAHKTNKFADVTYLKKRMLEIEETYNGDPEKKEEYLLDFFKLTFEEKVKDSFEDEIADVFIRLFDLIGHTKINIAEHIQLKMQYNATRARLHGKNY